MIFCGRKVMIGLTLGQVLVLHLPYSLNPEDVAVAGRAPLALSSACQEIVDRTRAPFLKIVEEIPGGLQPRHGGECGIPGRSGSRVL